MLLFTSAIVFDMGSTFYWFATDYDYALEHEQNQDIINYVLDYGIFGVFLEPLSNWTEYIIICFLGALIVGFFFFNTFKTKYTYFDKVMISFCLSFMLIAVWHYGCGIKNLTYALNIT